MTDNGRRELARRLHRIFLAPTEGMGVGLPVPDETLLRFADDILAADYTDPAYGDRTGDGGPPMRLVEVSDEAC